MDFQICKTKIYDKIISGQFENAIVLHFIVSNATYLIVAYFKYAQKITLRITKVM